MCKFTDVVAFASRRCGGGDGGDQNSLVEFIEVYEFKRVRNSQTNQEYMFNK